MLEWSLVTTLVERWRPETHSFYFSGGTIIVTLQDMAVITGLSVDEDLITGVEGTVEYYTSLCLDLLGSVPDMEPISSSVVKHDWFRDDMHIIPDGAGPEVHLRYVRAYNLMMLGSSLVPDTSDDWISPFFSFLEAS